MVDKQVKLAFSAVVLLVLYEASGNLPKQCYHYSSSSLPTSFEAVWMVTYKIKFVLISQFKHLMLQIFCWNVASAINAYKLDSSSAVLINLLEAVGC